MAGQEPLMRTAPAHGLLRKPYVASDPPFRRCSTNHFGGRPRRGLSSRQSIAGSSLTVRAVTSLAAALPPQTEQRTRHHAWISVARGAPGVWNRIGPVGGQWSAEAVPTSRPHSRHTISAWKRRCRTGGGGSDSSSCSADTGAASDSLANGGEVAPKGEPQKPQRTGTSAPGRQNTQAPHGQARGKPGSACSGTGARAVQQGTCQARTGKAPVAKRGLTCEPRRALSGPR